MRCRAAVATTLLLAGGCSTAGNPHPSGSSSPQPVAHADVTVDLTAQAERWPTQLRLKVGTLPDTLGEKFVPGLNPLIPASFFFSGSKLYVLDPVKHRIAIFAGGGRLESTLAPVGDDASDMALRSGVLYVIDEESDGRTLLFRGRDRQVLVDDVKEDDGTPDNPSRIALSDRGLAALTASGLHPIGPEFRADRRVLGLPTPHGLLTLSTISEDVLEATLPGRFDVRMTFRSPDPAVAPIVSMDTIQWSGDELYLWMQVGQETGVSAADGWYFLTLNSEGRLIHSAHVAGGPVSDVNETRHIFVTDDAEVWQMVVDRTSVEFRLAPTVH